MQPYFSEFLTVALIHLLAVMSPGPDFVMVCRNSLTRSRRSGMWSAVGLGFGILVHVTYSLIGIGYLIAQSIVLFTVLKWIGAAYLVWIGWQSLRAKPVTMTAAVTALADDISPLAAVRMGFLTNVLNPKATMFFLALFTQVIRPTTPAIVQVGYGMEMSVMTMLWFAGVAYALGHGAVRHRFQSIQHYVERTMGAILIALGVKVALSTR
ncbi:LysE family transporter [Candidatus Uhrbacteria bacterium]|nr:LysE family transporter [Candidatus Uhrbacteria bacterium]